MSDVTDDAGASAPEAPYEPPTAGSLLRSAREAAGLSIDDVAQQLKLAPRQVRALETDDFAALPGRTFVRGFVRNYARYVGLDADEVVSLLPGADVAPSLQRPTITPSSRPMGQLPADTPQRRSWARWAIPLVLVGLAAAAGIYEFRRQQAEPRKPASDAVARAPTASGPVTGAGTTSATLPNPLAASDATTTGAGNMVAQPPAVDAAQAPASGGVPASAAPGASGTATAAAPSTAPAASAESATSTAAPSDATLTLTFKGASWVQVKDRNGNVVLAETGQPGTSQGVSGALPLDVVIGNAAQVTATFRGQAIDLSPLTRGNVARFSLK